MTLPLIGFVSLQAFILGAIFIVCAVWGFIRGFKAEFSSLLVFAVTMALTAAPFVHGPATDLFASIFPAKGACIAYLTVFIFVFAALFYGMRFVPSLGDFSLVNTLERIMGVISGLVKGFVISTMFIVLLQGWRLPWDALYTSSELSGYVVRLWKLTGWMPELYSFKFLITF